MTSWLPKLLVVLVVAVAILFIYKPEAIFGAPNKDGISELYQSTTEAPPKYALHILFIGASYTYYNNMPSQLAQIASTDPGNPTQFFVQSVTRGGVSLKELWNDGDALKTIQSAHWDYVVLNQQSFWAMSEPSVHETHDYAGRFNAAIRQAGAKTLIFITWPRKPGTDWYTNPQYSFLHNPDYMLKMFESSSRDLAQSLGATPVDAGFYWKQALLAAPEIDLYNPDGSHPNQAGSYVVALSFYKTLTGRDLAPIGFHPRGLDDAAALKLRGIIAGSAPPP